MLPQGAADIPRVKRSDDFSALSQRHWTLNEEPQPVLTVSPLWLSPGASVTLNCSVKDPSAGWSFYWYKIIPKLSGSSYNFELLPGSSNGTDQDSYMVHGQTHTAGYVCRAGRGDPVSYTRYSKPAFVWSGEPQPVLTLSPLWLSPGASVTLNCSVKDPSAGWSFYWYKIIPKLSGSSYSFELLTGSRIGTDQDSYMVHGQTHTAGYVCRAGRGDPVSYTLYSKPVFVWSGDLHSAASLTVSPDRVQHFTEQPVSLSCEGNSAEWRVSRFSKFGHLSRCSSWGTMDGSTCNIHVSQLIDGVYWCESETAQFSNAVNITGENSDMILVSPVRPVAEGDPVTLGCKLRTQKVLSKVDFYKNGELIQNDTRMELTIPAVSQSDEGFYKWSSSLREPIRALLQSKLSAEMKINSKYTPLFSTVHKEKRIISKLREALRTT
ncbi:uncharacterized protein [Enoplosus armatus]|uniref:uncharacterized protein n=1 Tax=Enoplosus armatus TaxID=215367 RepID=UPI003993F479